MADPAIIEDGDPEFEAAEATQMEQGGIYFSFLDSVYRMVRDNGSVRFLRIIKTHSRSSFGTETRFNGTYPPDPPKENF